MESWKQQLTQELKVQKCSNMLLLLNGLNDSKMHWKVWTRNPQLLPDWKSEVVEALLGVEDEAHTDGFLQVWGEGAR